MTFFTQFLKSPKIVGAIVPSSKALALKIIEEAELKQQQVIVEIGPGTGVFTEQVAKNLSTKQTFFAIEFNAEFAELTRQRCPSVKIYDGDAQAIKQFLMNQGLSHCDCIISSLPWASFSSETQKKLLSTLHEVLAPGGRFVTFAYRPGMYLQSGRDFQSLLNQTFEEVKTTKTIWRNFPPAFVYNAVKKSPSV